MTQGTLTDSEIRAFVLAREGEGTFEAIERVVEALREEIDRSRANERAVRHILGAEAEETTLDVATRAARALAGAG